MARTEESTSVFTDDSGSRARMLQWGVRGLVAAIVLAAGLIVVSLVGGVALPGLDGPVKLPDTHRSKTERAGAPAATPTDGATPEMAGSTPGAEVVGTPADSAVAGGSTRPGTPGSAPQPTSGPTSGTPSTPTPTTAPTRGPGTRSTKSPNANSPNANSTEAPRADPTKAAGAGGQATPPGKTK